MFQSLTLASHYPTLASFTYLRSEKAGLDQEGQK